MFRVAIFKKVCFGKSNSEANLVQREYFWKHLYASV